MKINQTVQASHLYQMQSQPSETQKSDNVSTSIQGTSASVRISSAGRNAEHNWQAIADKYDVTNISTYERGAMTAELLENKLISSTEGLSLMAPLSINANPETKINFLDIMQKGFEAAKSNGTSQKQIELMKSTVNTLHQLHALAGNKDNNT